MLGFCFGGGFLFFLLYTDLINRYDYFINYYSDLVGVPAWCDVVEVSVNTCAIS